MPLPELLCLYPSRYPLKSLPIPHSLRTSLKLPKAPDEPTARRRLSKLPGFERHYGSGTGMLT